MVFSTAKMCLKSVAVSAALLSSTSALAQWQGTWGTTYGEVKLQQVQTHVYGDYGTWGTIEGVVSNDRRTVRGVYRRNDDGSKGYFEWRLVSTKGFSGRWASTQRSLPVWNSGGTSWTGRRTKDSKPRLSVYRGNGSLGAFMGAQERKYTRWISALYAQSSTSNASPARRSQAAAAEPKAVNPLAKRFRVFEEYPVSFKPRFFDVYLENIHIDHEIGASEIYGVAGIYAYCETARTSRRLIPFGGRKNRVWDVSRKYAVDHRRIFDPNRTTLRFAFDQACLNDPDARIAIQVQTNIKERDTRPALDDSWGYRPFKIYLDQINTDEKTCCVVEKQGEQVWNIRGVLGAASGFNDGPKVSLNHIDFQVTFAE